MADREINPDYLRVLAEDIERTHAHFRAGAIAGLAADMRMARHLADIREMLPANAAPAWHERLEPAVYAALTGEAADVAAGCAKLKANAERSQTES